MADAETVRIEIPIETIDETSAGINAAVSGLRKLQQAYQNAGRSAQSSQRQVSQFDRSAERTQRSLQSWMREKYEILLKAKDQISPVVDKIRSGLRSFGGRVWSTTVKVIDKATAPIQKIFSLLKNPIVQAGAVLGISVGFKDTIDTYKDFEATMSNVSAISGATGSDLEQLTAKAKEMGATTKFTAKEAGDAFTYMAMAGWKTKDMLGGIEGIMNLAAASGEDLGEVSDIVTDALTAFGMKANESGHFADVLAAASSNSNTNVAMMGETFKYAASMAGSLGYSVEDVATAIGLMANSGIKSSMAGTGLNTIMTRLATDAGASSKRLGALGTLTKELGVDFYDAKGKALPLIDVIDGMRKSMSKLSDQRKSEIAKVIAGTEAQKSLLAIVNASESDYKKLRNAINDADGAAGRMAETNLDNLQGSLTLLQSALDGVKIDLGQRLAPYVRQFADWLTGEMPGISSALQDLMDKFDVAFDGFKKKWNDLKSSPEFQNADIFGKIQISWDKMIAEPFHKWWISTGKAKIASVMANVGEGIGKGMSMTILTLLGIDYNSVGNEAVSVGASFAEGFAKGFQAKEVRNAIVDSIGAIFKSASGLFTNDTTLGSFISAFLIAKVSTSLISGIGSMVKGIKGIVDVAKPMVGSFTLGSIFDEFGTLTGPTAAAGTGLLGKLGMIGANAGATSSAGAVALGAGAVGGGIAAGVAGIDTVRQGVTALQAYKAGNKDKAKVYGTGAGITGGAMATGALIGTAFGGPVGTLIGAGIGGVAGMVISHKREKDYEKEVKEAEERSKKAKTFMEATGMSIDKITTKDKDLQKALNDTKTSGAEAAAMFLDKSKEIENKAFGKIKLSLTEIKKMAKDVALGDRAKEFEDYGNAVSDSESALSNFQTAMSTLQKENWKASLGITMDETDQSTYQNAVDDFIKNAEQYISNVGYQTKSAGTLLFGDGYDSSSDDTLFKSIYEQIESLGDKLQGKVRIALKDGVISLNESKEITNLQQQISDIMQKVADAEANAKQESWKMEVERNGAAMDSDSFAQYQKQLQDQAQEAQNDLKSATQSKIASEYLKANGDTSSDSYKQAIAGIQESYYAQSDQLAQSIVTTQLDAISNAWSSQLDNYMPGIAGSLSDKLSTTLQSAISSTPDIKGMSAVDIGKLMGLDKLNLDSATVNNIQTELWNVIQSIPDETLKQMSESGSKVTEAWLNGAQAPIAGASSVLTAGLSGACTQAANNVSGMSFNANPTISVMPKVNVLQPSTLPTLNNITNWYNKQHNEMLGIGGKAAGGYVSGGPQLSWLAEEGYGEYVIPTNPARRNRALDLYEQAGKSLGVQYHADGGFVSGSNDAGGDLYGSDGENASESLYEPQSGMSGSNGTMNFEVSVNPQFNIQASDGQSEEDIMRIIKRHMKEMTDEVGGNMANMLRDIFSNMPMESEA